MINNCNYLFHFQVSEFHKEAESLKQDNQDSNQKISSIQEDVTKADDKLKTAITSSETQIDLAGKSILYMRAFNDIIASTKEIRRQVQGSEERGNLQETESKLSSLLKLLDQIESQKSCIKSVIKSGKKLVDSENSTSDDIKSKIMNGNLRMSSNHEKLMECWENKKSEYEDRIKFLKSFECMDLSELSL